MKTFRLVKCLGEKYSGGYKSVEERCSDLFDLLREI